MQTGNFKIEPYNDNFREQVLTVWENSVLASHNFLTPNDFKEIKELVKTINFNDFEVFCLTNENVVFGFIGVADKKVEMLFLDPKIFGLGFGLRLLNFAVNQLHADKVDVNEQNPRAVQFYQKFGFETFERTEKDAQGKDFPLLRMKLKET